MDMPPNFVWMYVPKLSTDFDAGLRYGLNTRAKSLWREVFSGKIQIVTYIRDTWREAVSGVMAADFA